MAYGGAETGVWSTPLTVKITLITPVPVTAARMMIVSPSAMASLAPATVEGRDVGVRTVAALTAGLVILTPKSEDWTTRKVMESEPSLPSASAAVAFTLKDETPDGTVTSTVYGASVSLATSVPATLKITDTTPRSSLASAVTVTTSLAETDVPEDGEIIRITGDRFTAGLSSGLGLFKHSSVTR